MQRVIYVGEPETSVSKWHAQEDLNKAHRRTPGPLKDGTFLGCVGTPSRREGRGRVPCTEHWITFSPFIKQSHMSSAHCAAEDMTPLSVSPLPSTPATSITVKKDLSDTMQFQPLSQHNNICVVLKNICVATSRERQSSAHTLKKKPDAAGSRVHSV